MARPNAYKHSSFWKDWLINIWPKTFGAQKESWDIRYSCILLGYFFQGYSDSVYWQQKLQSEFYFKLVEKGVYINQPDNYFYQGGSRTGKNSLLVFKVWSEVGWLASRYQMVWHQKSLVSERLRGTPMEGLETIQAGCLETKMSDLSSCNYLGCKQGIRRSELAKSLGLILVTDWPRLFSPCFWAQGKQTLKER